MKKQFVERLAELRGEKTKQAFAKLLAIPQNTYLRYENSEDKTLPKVDILKRIATVCGVSADWLLGLSDDRNGKSATGTPYEIVDAPANWDIHDRELSDSEHAVYRSISAGTGTSRAAIKAHQARRYMLYLYDTDPALRSAIDQVVRLRNPETDDPRPSEDLAQITHELRPKQAAALASLIRRTSRDSDYTGEPIKPVHRQPHPLYVKIQQPQSDKATKERPA